jgi:biopolymer transport protein TolQ
MEPVFAMPTDAWTLAGPILEGLAALFGGPLAQGDMPALNPTPRLGAPAPETDLSLIGLVRSADIVVKTVMALLVLASIWCWAIIIGKWRQLGRLRRRAAEFEERFWSGGSLEDLYDRVGDRPGEPMAAMFAAAMKEWRHAADHGLTVTTAMRAGLQQRIERVMAVAQGRELARVERHMTFLASVGSTAPFLGLFGTVWGIMNAFTSIAAAANTSLAVVAPGIAEALFATALGLFAAIPASAFYNHFVNAIGRYADRLDGFSGEFSAILSRHLEERG